MKRALLAGIAALGCAAVSAGTDPATLRSLFPDEADVFVEGDGLARIDLPPEVVAACLGSLADVRLFDPAGAEIPFLLDTPRIEKVHEMERIEARPLQAGREESPRANGPSIRRERFELEGPDHAARAGTWSLVADVPRSEFVSKIRVEWQSREGSGHGSVDASVFRLAAHQSAEKLGTALQAGGMQHVTIVLEHENPFWLEPAFRFESARTTDRKARSSVPLPVVATRSASGATIIELRRPRGVVPATLELSTATPVFDRKITVHDDGPGHDAAPLGEARLFRLVPEKEVQILEIPLRPAHGDRLRIVIDDGDSPPLAQPAFNAVFSQPSLVASLVDPGGQAPAAVLRFGGGRASVPRYDLAGLRPEPGQEVFGKRAEALLQLYDVSSVRTARLGPIRPNGTFDSAPALAFAMRPGATIDTRPFERRRTVRFQPSPEGLSRLRLMPEDVAGLRPDLADLRIVDAGSHQWPYLIERGSATVDVPLRVAAATKDKATTYTLTSATSPLTLDRLTVDADVAFFDRAFRLSGKVDSGGARMLAQGRIARRAGDPAPVTIAIDSARVEDLELRIDDGDDAPLPLRSVIARVSAPEVFVAAPAGSYTMLLGAPVADSPTYELARVRDVILAVSVADAVTEPIEKNPAHTLAARLAQGSGPRQTALWAAIVAAVVVLGGLTLRLTRQAPPPA